VSASVIGRQSSVGASFQWVRVFNGCESSAGASFQWEPVFSKGSECQSSVGASVSGCQSSVERVFSFQWKSVLSLEGRE
jgi:hypothetical protein